ncbi:MAG: hypothetical protein CVT92_00410 [Bacteroidetes bacterium HGW-Bacteroidetes-1]|jgi:tetratricopeptide (TPR) repeat protein|nr:MAG: hypothetical protein CVT92_00410 [Bacteroidetes bacterium HGW-Bacteroidetes-1]
MDEDFQWEDDFQIEELADRFEKMIRSGSDEYFDSEEFELLIEYFQMTLNNEKSRIALDIAIQMHPYNNRLKIMSARQMATDGKFVKALSLLAEVENYEPADAEILMTKGSVYSMMLDFPKAVEEYEKALVIVDEDEMEEVYSSIAFEYENMGAFDTALEYLVKALEISTYPDQLLYEIGMCYEMAKTMEDSIAFFIIYLDSNPSSVAAWFNLGLSYHHLDLYEKAIDAFEFAIAIDETYIPAYLSMAQSYANLNNYSKAIEIYHETSEHEKPEALTLYYIGECHEKLFEYDKALEFYHQSIELDENLPEPWAGIGVIYDERGDTKTGIGYLEKAIELDQLNTEFMLIQADLYIKMNLLDKAKTCFQRIEEIDPLDPDLWKEYANMYIIGGETEKAVQVLKTGLIHQPDNTEIMYRLVATLLINNNYNQAVYYLENALELNFDGHLELFEYVPSLRHNTKLLDLILQFTPWK